MAFLVALMAWFVPISETKIRFPMVVYLIVFATLFASAVHGFSNDPEEKKVIRR